MMRFLASLLALLFCAAPVWAQDNWDPDRPLVLLTNDDGYLSEDLRVLARALDDDFTLLIIAPRGNQSGISNAISGLRNPAEWSQFDVEAAGLDPWNAEGYWIDASPSVAVHWGLDFARRLYGRTPDLVISGMNSGDNLGQ